MVIIGQTDMGLAWLWLWANGGCWNLHQGHHCVHDPIFPSRPPAAKAETAANIPMAFSAVWAEIMGVWNWQLKNNSANTVLLLLG